MGKYVTTNLIKDETVKYEGKVSLYSLLPRILLGFLLLPVFGVGILLWISAALSYYTTELAITNKRLIAKFGFIQRSTVEMNIAKIESVQVEQGILGRLFNFGSILIAGAGDPKAPISGISMPIKFRNAFFEVQEEG